MPYLSVYRTGTVESTQNAKKWGIQPNRGEASFIMKHSPYGLDRKYVGLSISCLIAQHHTVCAVDLIKSKVDSINNRKSPIQDEYIEKYLAEKDLDLTATLDGEAAYRDADFVVIAAPTNVYSTNRIDVETSKRTCFAHYIGR